MKNKPCVSIIIPVYNVEKYLKQCVESVIRQSFKDVEIILIDDGSKDGSGKICDDFAKRDPRIKVFHKKNGGLSDARNYGIDRASGQYIMFIDSDDWIDYDYVATYVEVAKNETADLVVGGIKSAYGKNEKAVPLKTIKHVSPHELFKEMFLGNGEVISACGKIYSREIFSKIRYDYGELYEDFLLFDKIVENSSNIIRIDYSGYFYYVRNDSITKSCFNKKRLVLIKKSEDYIKYSKERFPDLVDASVRRYVVSCFNVLSASIKDKSNDRITRRIRRDILSCNKRIIFGNEYSIKDKFQTVLLYGGLTPYRCVLKMHYAIKMKRASGGVNDD